MIDASERVKTGIEGFDKLVAGGLIKKSINLLCGETGTGKTTFALEYIWNGLNLGENGVYITLEEDEEEIKANARQFGWDFDKFIEEGKCIIKYIAPESFEDLRSKIFSSVNKIGAQRLAIDNLSLLAVSISFTSKLGLRQKLFSFFKDLKKSTVTTLMLSEIAEGESQISRWGVEEFMSDTVIIMYYLKYAASGTPRNLMIRKMRLSNHSFDIHAFEIAKKGIAIK